MRWILLDQILELKKGQTAKAAKNISLQEDYLLDQLPACPIVPHTLLLESMAQTGGILAGLSYEFKRDLFLAKIEQVIFSEPIYVPAQLTFEATLTELSDEGCRFTAKTLNYGKQVATANYLLVVAPKDKVLNTEPVVFNSSFIQVFRLEQYLNPTLDTRV